MARVRDGKRVVGYCRVSTEEQAREGFSLRAQEERIRAYCAVNGLELAGCEVDEGVSGKSLRRPGWERVRRALRAGEAAGVVFVKLDRLSRNLEDVIDLMRESEREGWGMHSLHEKLDSSSAIGRFFVQMLASLAELERGQISERVTEGMRRARVEGRRVSGRAPYGYAFVDGRLVEVAGEQAVLAEMLARSERGEGCVTIARRLDGAGLRARGGRAWYPQLVARVLATARVSGTRCEVG